MKRQSTKMLVLSAVFLAIGMILPLLTAQMKEIGDTLLPMHFPVLLCGLICGPWYGLTVGLLLPFLRSVSFGMPPIYPNAVWMSLELSTYGGMIGFLYRLPWKNMILKRYGSLFGAMIFGRIVWGISKAVLLGLGGKTFPITAFVAGGFLDAFLGIVLQVILIPEILHFLDKNKKTDINNKENN